MRSHKGRVISSEQREVDMKSNARGVQLWHHEKFPKICNKAAAWANGFGFPKTQAWPKPLPGRDFGLAWPGLIGLTQSLDRLCPVNLLTSY
jgi:hypothetical protein